MWKEKKLTREIIPARVYAADTKVLEEEGVYRKLYESLSDYRKLKTDRLKSEKDKIRSVAAGILTEKAYVDYIHRVNLNLSAMVPEIIAGDKNKPYFKDSPIYFNLSHSGSRVMCAMAVSEVGCDVEIKKGSLQIAKRFFAEEEYSKIADIEDEVQRDELFTQIWTIKESVVKTLGDGLSYPLSDFSVIESDGFASVISIPKKEGNYNIKVFNINDGYKYACCAKNCSIDDEIRWIKLDA